MPRKVGLGFGVLFLGWIRPSVIFRLTHWLHTVLVHIYAYALTGSACMFEVHIYLKMQFRCRLAEVTDFWLRYPNFAELRSRNL